MVWKFAEVIKQMAEADLPTTASAELAKGEEMQHK